MCSRYKLELWQDLEPQGSPYSTFSDVVVSSMLLAAQVCRSRGSEMPRHLQETVLRVRLPVLFSSWYLYNLCIWVIEKCPQTLSCSFFQEMETMNMGGLRDLLLNRSVWRERCYVISEAPPWLSLPWNSVLGTSMWWRPDHTEKAMDSCLIDSCHWGACL